MAGTSCHSSKKNKAAEVVPKHLPEVELQGRWPKYVKNVQHDVLQFEPSMIRKYSESVNEEPWYNFTSWIVMDGALVDAPYNEEFDKHFQALFNPVVNRVLKSLTMKDEYWSSTLPVESGVTKQQRAIAEGFMYGMHNAAGRQCVQSLLEILFQSSETILIKNMGGDSLYDPSVRNVCFPDEVRSPSLSSDAIESEDPEPVQYKTRGAKRKVSFSFEEPEPEYFKKHFVPDVVALKYKEGVDSPPITLLTVSVKSSSNITQEAYNQIRFQMLPVLLKRRQALGVVICAKEAAMCLLHINKHSQIETRCSRYSWIQLEDPMSFDEENFKKMCRNILYYTTKSSSWNFPA